MQVATTSAACWMCIIPGYTLGINSSFVVGWGEMYCGIYLLPWYGLSRRRSWSAPDVRIPLGVVLVPLVFVYCRGG